LIKATVVELVLVLRLLLAAAVVEVLLVVATQPRPWLALAVMVLPHLSREQV
jgi:hypothetical protein